MKRSEPRLSYLSVNQQFVSKIHSPSYGKRLLQTTHACVTQLGNMHSSHAHIFAADSVAQLEVCPIFECSNSSFPNHMTATFQ